MAHSFIEKLYPCSECRRSAGEGILIIAAAGALGYIFAYENLPASASQLVTGITEEPMLLMTPIFLPVIVEAGHDPVAFGIIMVILVTMGGMTPPVGVTMFAVSSITKTSIGEYTRGALPFIGAVLILIILLALVTQISLLVPNLLLN